MAKNDFAVIKTGGKQYLVSKGDEILVDRINEKKGKKLNLETLLKSGKTIKIGSPTLKTGVVKAEIIEEIKDKKLVIFKYKAKKRYRKKTGFRPFYRGVVRTIKKKAAGITWGQVLLFLFKNHIRRFISREYAIRQIP